MSECELSLGHRDHVPIAAAAAAAAFEGGREGPDLPYFRVSGFRFPVSGFRFQGSGFRFQVSGWFLGVLVCSLEQT